MGGLAPPPAPEAQPELEEALREVLAAGLPVLEHNGFTALWQPQGDATGTSSASAAAPGAGASSSGGEGSVAAAAAVAALADQVAKCCTGSTALGLGAFVRDQASGTFSMLSSPVGPLPSGRGLVLVGDLNLGPKRHGRSAAHTTARFLTAAVGDARQLVL